MVELLFQPKMIATRHVHPEDSAADGVAREVTVAFCDVTFTAKSGAEILKRDGNICGVVQPGELVWLMGPSGAGKTTLLDALAHRVERRSLGGQVLLNGRESSARDFRKCASFVPQQDALLGSLTVQETMNFVARMVAAKNVTAAHRKEHVQAVIQRFGLSGAANVIVGNQFKKGLSGGQIRRLSIAVELLADSPILLLDEPTSGLDAAAAWHVASLLRQTATSERKTVICTIHQPSSDVFFLANKVLLLAEGHCVYFGPTGGLLDAMAKWGAPCPSLFNPADHALKMLNRDFARSGTTVEAAFSWFAGEPAAAVRQEIEQQRAAPMASERLRCPTTSAGAFRKWAVLTQRQLLNNVRDPGIIWVRLAMYTLLSLLIISLYWRLGTDNRAVQDRISVLFFVGAFLVFMSIAVLPFLVEQRAVFVRERSNGLYGPGTYALVNAVVALPGVILITAVSSFIIYPVVGLRNGAGHFMLFFMDLALSLYTAEMFMMLTAVLFPSFIVGMAVASGVYGASMLLCGFFVQVPDYWVWGQIITFHRYTFGIFMYNEFNGRTFDSTIYPTGETVLQFYTVAGISLVVYSLALVCFIAAFFVLFYLVLRFKYKGAR